MADNQPGLRSRPSASVARAAGVRRRMGTAARLMLLMVLIATLAACGSRGDERDELDYGPSTEEERELHVPPDLELRAGNGQYNMPPGNGRQGSRQPAVLPDAEGVRFVREGGETWLEVDRSVEELWPHLERFWEKQGFELARSDRQHGTIETDWRESLGDKPDGVLRRALGTVGNRMYSAGLRDQYRLWVERGGSAEATRIFIVHRGRQRVRDGEALRWESRESEPERAVEMQRRLLAHLGIDESEADRVMSNGLVDQDADRRFQVDEDADGRPVLVLEAGFARSWRMVGRALEQRGFRVEDRNRDDGVYYIRYLDPDRAEQRGGFFSRLAFWRDSEPESADYEIRLEEADRNTRIAVHDNNGTRDGSSTAARILDLIGEQLNP